MRSAIGVMLAAAAALGLIAGVVYGLGDREMLTAPPGAVTEGFVKQLASRRADRAVPYLTEGLQRRVGEADLRRSADTFVRRLGHIEDVQGEEIRISSGEAAAKSQIKTSKGGTRTLEFGLRFEKGVWKIHQLPEELR